jgi:Spy/CpxP family protein refolding chaperone
MRTRAFFFMLIACSAFAQFERPDLSKYFSLTDAQIAQWDQLKAANRQENAERSIKRGALFVEFSQLLAAEVLDESRIGANQIAQVLLDREEARAQQFLMDRTVAVLDANQRAKLNVLEEARKLEGLVQAAECQNLLIRRSVLVLNGFVIGGCFDDFFTDFSDSLKTKTFPQAESLIGFPNVVIRYLELSSSQVETLSAIRDAYVRAQAPKQVERATKVSNLYGSELTRPVLDPAAIGKLIAEITRLDRSFVTSDQELVKQLRERLTESQTAKLDAIGPALAIAANEGPVRCAGFFPQRWGSFSSRSPFFWGTSLIDDPYRTTGCVDPRNLLGSFGGSAVSPGPASSFEGAGARLRPGVPRLLPPHGR